MTVDGLRLEPVDPTSEPQSWELGHLHLSLGGHMFTSAGCAAMMLYVTVVDLMSQLTLLLTGGRREAEVIGAGSSFALWLRWSRGTIRVSTSPRAAGVTVDAEQLRELILRDVRAFVGARPLRETEAIAEDLASALDELDRCAR